MKVAAVVVARSVFTAHCIQKLSIRVVMVTPERSLNPIARFCSPNLEGRTLRLDLSETELFKR